MRFLRLALPALAFVVAGSWASHSTACEDSKASARTAATRKSSSACTAQMAAKCTPEMAAACRAKGVSAATIAHSSCSAKTSAVTASKSSDHCSSAKMSAAAYAASMGACTSSKSASSNESCAAHKSATTASANGHESCAGHKTSSMAATIGAGGSCSGRGMGVTAGKAMHGDCDACSDMALCYEELESAGTRTQVVPLKNGVMFVYTAESPGRVNAVQTAMARRNERLTQLISAGDKAHLCPECKTIRGAVASGKMTREVINIEGGALTLMTSNDPSVVAKIHAMVENHKGMRSKI